MTQTTKLTGTIVSRIKPLVFSFGMNYKLFYIYHCFRNVLSYIMIPLIQNQLDEFKSMIWNPHRIRYQKETYMADGIPNHIYEFPVKYELEECGMAINDI